MSVDKYPFTFSRQMATVVYLLSKLMKRSTDNARSDGQIFSRVCTGRNQFHDQG